RLIRFRHFCSGLLALASLDRACRNLVPTFPQRSPPRLLTAAACGGLRSAPDCRTRRALLHLSYSYAPPCGPRVARDTRPTADLGRERFVERQLWNITGVAQPRRGSLQLLDLENFARTRSLPQILFPAFRGCPLKYAFRSSKYLSMAALASSTDV